MESKFALKHRMSSTMTADDVTFGPATFTSSLEDTNAVGSAIYNT